MKTNELELATVDGPMRAFEASPPDPRGAVIVVPEAFGLNEHIEGVATRYADGGFCALGVDVFHRAGGGIAAYDDFKAALALSVGLDDDGFLADLDAAIAHLESRGIAPSRQGIVGYCVGGRFSFLAALRRPLGAAISYYGGGIVQQGAFPALPAIIDEVPSLRVPWLGFFGDLDRSIPSDDVATLRKALVDVGVPHEIVQYPGANHGFNCDARSAYHAEASADAFDRAVAWLTLHLR